MTPIRRRHPAGLLRALPIKALLPTTWLLAALVLLGAASPAAAATGPQPLSPQPARVEPGLVPTYYRDVTFNMIDEVLRWAKDNKGEAGKPIPNIDAVTSGEMWDSGMPHLYGIRIDGAVRLPAGSTYFAVSSNDGVRVLLGGMQILEDPDVHADRLTDPVEVKAPAAGWYPLRIWYFQKKNTAGLRLLWQPPGAKDFAPVPPEALGHP
jgi:hypothetical protein